jgi:RHS repeat-associated protein
MLQSFNVNNLNELATVTNRGQLTVADSTTSPATNVTVNASNAVLYADVTFASTNQPWASGNNTYTAIAHDAYGRSSTNSLTVSLNGTNTYTYDSNGNLLSDGTRNFAYDDENELIEVEVASAWSNNFVYDGKMRRRIERDYTWSSGSWILASETHFIYDGNVVVQERNANNLPTVTYTRGNDLSGTLQGAGGIGGLLARTSNTQLLTAQPFASTLYHSDGNGNVTCLVYTNGLLAAKYLYDPFGSTLAQYGSLASANSYRFSSKEWNANSGLYYYLYRFYDPNLQRWLNRDPIEESGFKLLSQSDYSGVTDGDDNLYAFSGNDSLNNYDLLGLCVPLPDSGSGSVNGSNPGHILKHKLHKHGLLPPIFGDGSAATITFNVCCPSVAQYLKTWGESALPTYVGAPPATENGHSFPYFVVSGPSGSGPCYTIVLEVPSTIATEYWTGTTAYANFLTTIRIVGKCCDCSSGSPTQSNPPVSPPLTPPGRHGSGN